ncbi:c-type cytochrome [Caulobacter vibrioides]|uniref:Cytochrome c-family protein n=1 Tax=Caulobacter vibrioides (strain NA1000 / CB15N) TaxID=565050 RepID=A0A0H3CA34_CAUVN|nr:cytochrome c [Caulobacter vibrioides]YP_002517573.1 cytochrome c-family protein [Caulobacter vibrioides NA1000]ACL95665.1 cytochrome c-family protein [Caulobacter vibrioides NA1000]ATC28986.1 cytochrome c-family protein [Caulobacter vibrioides]QXZ50499.1 cytochrome c [Caulobacter vibrioides]
MEGWPMRTEIRWSVVVLGAVMAFATTSQAAQDQDPIARGKAIVTRSCSACHAVEVSGDSPNPTAPRFRQLHQRYDVEALAEGLAEGLTVGHGPMPEWTFPPADVSAIVAYLKSIQTQDSGATIPPPQPRP